MGEVRAMWARWLTAGMLLVLMMMGCGADGLPATGSGQQDASAPDVALQDAPGAPAFTSTGGAVSAPFDVGAVMHQVHFAYRKEGEAFAAGHDTYQVRVTGGDLVLTPYHHPAGEQIIEGAPMVLRTTSIGRAPSARRLVARARVRDDGVLELAHESAVETLRNSEDGVQQSWSFDDAPSGTGDLVVRVSVQDTSYLGETRLGLHFADPKTGLGFSYGVATWIDAKGKMVEVRPQWSGDEIVMTVPAEVVDAAAYPAVLDPTIGPEFGMDNPVMVPSASSTARPEVAWDGTNWLVAWTDSRSGTTTDTYGARVTATGAVVDSLGFRIATSRSLQGLAFDGTNYLVLLRGANTEGQFVSPAGALVGGAFSISNISGARLAFNGTNYLVIESSASSTTPMRGVFVSKAGSVGSPFTIRSTSLTDSSQVPQSATVACNTAALCLVTWAEYVPTAYPAVRRIFAQRVSSSGLTGALIQFAQDFNCSLGLCEDSAPGATWGGSNFLVGYREWFFYPYSSTYSSSILCRLVSTTGTVSSQSIIYQVAEQDNALGGAPALGFDGTNYLVIHGTTGNTKGTRVSTSGTVLTPTVDLATGSPVNVAFGSTTYLVAFAASGVKAARVSTVPSLLDPSHILVGRVINSQNGPAVGFDGTNYLVVWSDSRGGAKIYGTRVTKTGSALDVSGIAISTAANYHSLPAVAFDGTNYLVVWQRSTNNGDIYGARVTKAGGLLDATNLAISTGAGIETRPKVAFDGTNYLVVWDTDADIMGRRVATSGSLLSAITISSASGAQRNATVAFGNPDYLVAWDDDRAGNYDIYGTRVTTGGAVVDGVTTGFPISTAPGDQNTPDVAFDGTNFLTVWRDRRATLPGVYGTRVSSAGSVLDVVTSGIAISTATANQTAPKVAYTHDGTNFLAVWQDERSGTATVRGDIYGAWVTRGGVVLDPGGVAISTGSAPEHAPALAPDTSGGLLVAYETKNVSSPDYSSRVRGRLVTSDGLLGTSCSVAAQCASRICKDSLCCSAACAGTCETCAATPGTCSTVTNAEDPDTCTGGSTCSATGTCKLKDGQPCTGASQCLNAACVDGVCCNSDCSGPCLSCTNVLKGSGPDGECGATASGKDPENNCAEDTVDICGLDGECNGAGGCRFRSAGTTCGATTCNGNLVQGKVCSGAGGCVEQPGTSCAPYQCIGTACKIPCTADWDCISGHFCDSGTCKETMGR